MVSELVCCQDDHVCPISGVAVRRAERAVFEYALQPAMDA